MKYQRGFTIAELIIVVVIAGVLAAMAAPNMSEFVKNNARATRVNTMVTALNFARGQAVTRNSRVSLCKSAGFASCDAAGTGNFENGWIVFTDHIPAFAGGTVGTIDTGIAGWPDEVVLRVFQPDMGNNATLVATNTPIGAIRGLSYEGNGLGRDMDPPAGATLVSADTVIRYCDDRGASEARGIVISPTGGASLTRDTDGDGTDDIGGVNLVCP